MTFDSATLCARTTAGEAELATPSQGLSLGQRRVLTLLQNPSAVDELAQKYRLEPEKLARDLTRLADLKLIQLHGPATVAPDVRSPGRAPRPVDGACGHRSQHPAIGCTAVVCGSRRHRAGRGPLVWHSHARAGRRRLAADSAGARCERFRDRQRAGARARRLRRSHPMPRPRPPPSCGETRVPAEFRAGCPSGSHSGRRQRRCHQCCSRAETGRTQDGACARSVAARRGRRCPGAGGTARPGVGGTATPRRRWRRSPRRSRPRRPQQPSWLRRLRRRFSLPPPRPRPHRARPSAVTELKPLSREPPDFPREAIAAGITKVWSARASTSMRAASVTAVDILGGQPQHVFDRAVRNALSRWQFEPIAAARTSDVEINFQRE